MRNYLKERSKGSLKIFIERRLSGHLREEFCGVTDVNLEMKVASPCEFARDVDAANTPYLRLSVAQFNNVFENIEKKTLK